MGIHHAFDIHHDVFAVRDRAARGPLVFQGFAVVALLAFGALTIVTAGTAAEPTLDRGDVSSRGDGLRVEQLDMVDWAVDLFDAAGLVLPSIDFVAYADRAACRGRAGLTSYDGPVTEVRLCGAAVGPTSDWVLLHELGHVWTTYTLGPQERQAFVEVRGLDAWKQGEWHERGAEHASEILVWGLMDRPVVPGHIDQNSCGELLAGYLALVDDEPLNGFTDLCSS